MATTPTAKASTRKPATAKAKPVATATQDKAADSAALLLVGGGESNTPNPNAEPGTDAQGANGQPAAPADSAGAETPAAPPAEDGADDAPAAPPVAPADDTPADPAPAPESDADEGATGPVEAEVQTPAPVPLVRRVSSSLHEPIHIPGTNVTLDPLQTVEVEFRDERHRAAVHRSLEQLSVLRGWTAGHGVHWETENHGE